MVQRVSTVAFEGIEVRPVDCTTITEVARSVSIAGKATLTIDSSM